MSMLDKIERKMGRFAISNLMKYIVIGNIIAYILTLVNPMYLTYLVLDPILVLKGQVWRLITFVFIPESTGNLIFFVISLYFMYFIGSALESYWGAFRFNLFYLVGIIGTILSSFVFKTYGTPSYLNETLFLAFATLYPNMQVFIFFFIPIKVKWIGIFTAAVLLLQFINGPWVIRGFIIVSMLNYILFFGPELVRLIRGTRRRQAYERKVQQHRSPYKSPSKGKIINDIPFHRCYVCGITEKDDPNMQFRYCSSCNGNYEYCMDHLHNHEHVQ